MVAREAVAMRVGDIVDEALELRVFDSGDTATLGANYMVVMSAKWVS